VARHLAGELTLEEAIRGTVRRTRALARRQLAWFKRDPRIRWFVADDRGAVAIVDELEGYLRG
jgi:tRNA dimethylallyltransferase